MNKSILILILIYLISSKANAQSDSFEIDFFEFDPIWSHTISNPFIKDSLKYLYIEPGNILEENEKLFLLNYVDASNFDKSGYIIDKIDKKNAQKEWSFYSTKVDSFQEYIRYMVLDKNQLLLKGSIRTEGFKSNPSLTDLWALNLHSGKLSNTIVDKEKGQLKEKCNNGDTINFCPILFNQFQNQNQIVLKQDAFNDPNNTKDLANMAFYFYKIINNCNINYEQPIKIIPYETEDSLGYFSLEHQLPIMETSSSSVTAIVIQGRKDKAPFRFQLIWFDVSDINNIKVLKKKNYEDYIPYSNESLVSFRNYYLNNQIFLSHRYYDTLNNTKVNYLLWMDSQGEIVSMVKPCIIDNHPYTYFFAVYADNDLSYFLAHPTKTGRSGFDILKLKRGENNLEYISSITTINSNETFNANLRVHQLLSNGNLIIGSQSKIRFPNNENNIRVVYYCFDGNKLGIKLTSSDKDISSLPSFTISPNPSTSYININTDLDFDELALYEVNGAIALKSNSQDQVDLSTLANGTYLCELRRNGKAVSSVVKVVKVE